MSDNYNPEEPAVAPPLRLRRRGRRLPFLLLALGLYAAFFVYDLWRPLNEAERRLVGTWIESPEKTLQDLYQTELTFAKGPRTEMTFTADRRLEMSMIANQGIRISLGAGSWSIRRNHLRFRLDRRPDQIPAVVRSWSDVLSLATRPFSRFSDSAPIVFEGEDRMGWGDDEYDRVPTKAESM